MELLVRTLESYLTQRKGRKVTVTVVNFKSSGTRIWSTLVKTKGVHLGLDISVKEGRRTRTDVIPTGWMQLVKDPELVAYSGSSTLGVQVGGPLSKD